MRQRTPQYRDRCRTPSHAASFYAFNSVRTTLGATARFPFTVPGVGQPITVDVTEPLNPNLVITFDVAQNVAFIPLPTN